MRIATALSLGALLAAAGCGSTPSNCTADYKCANGQTWHYCGGVSPPYYEGSDGKKFVCETDTACAMGLAAFKAWCNTAPADLAGTQPTDAAAPDDGSPAAGG